TPRSGLELLAGTLHSWAQPAGMVDAFLALLAVGVVLGLVRAATGNIAACTGLHAGWVWVMLVAHELTRPARGAPLGFLLSRFDGFVGWLVLAWTAVLAVPLWRYYSRRAARAERSEEHTSELQSLAYLVCRLLLEKKKKKEHVRIK